MANTHRHKKSVRVKKRLAKLLFEPKNHLKTKPYLVLNKKKLPTLQTIINEFTK